MKKPTIDQIKFFTPQDNSTSDIKARPTTKFIPKGYISPAGNLVFPAITLEELGVEENTLFKIGSDEGERKIQRIYLRPSEDKNDSFPLQKSGRGSVIFLAPVLKKGGVDFKVRNLLLRQYLLNSMKD